MNTQSADQSGMAASTGSGRAGLPGWHALQKHAEQMREVTLRSLVDGSPGRAGEFTIESLGCTRTSQRTGSPLKRWAC